MNKLIVAMLALILVVVIYTTTQEPAALTDKPENEINPTVNGLEVKELIEMESERQGVDTEIVYAIINSPQPDDGAVRYGLMKIHEDLVEKYNVNWSDGEGIIENPKANVMAGIGRLKWAAENNATLNGMLMVYIYTKPNAQRLWADEAKTTDWVESVKGEI